MFTGLVEETGTVLFIRRTGSSIKLGLRTDITFSDLKIGDSLCVNGVCLTITEKRNDKAVFVDVTPETFSKTNFNSLLIGQKVNLERAMKADGRFGGHIVSGHIDGTGKIKEIKKNGNSYEYCFSASKELLEGMVKKGSVTINGISLTIADLTENTFTIAVIPHTLKNTNLEFLKENSTVNIECDILGKYVQKYIMSGGIKI